MPPDEFWRFLIPLSHQTYNLSRVNFKTSVKRVLIHQAVRSIFGFDALIMKQHTSHSTPKQYIYLILLFLSETLSQVSWARSHFSWNKCTILFARAIIIMRIAICAPDFAATCAPQLCGRSQTAGIYSHADAVNNIAIANNVIKHFYLEGTLLLGGRRVASPCALLWTYIHCESAESLQCIVEREREMRVADNCGVIYITN